MFSEKLTPLPTVILSIQDQVQEYNIQEDEVQEHEVQVHELQKNQVQGSEVQENEVQEDEENGNFSLILKCLLILITLGRWG